MMWRIERPKIPAWARAAWLRRRIEGRRFECDRCAAVFRPQPTDFYLGTNPTVEIRQGMAYRCWRARIAVTDRPGVWVLSRQARVGALVTFHGSCPSCEAGQAWIVSPLSVWEWIRWNVFMSNDVIGEEEYRREQWRRDHGLEPYRDGGAGGD